MAILKQYLNRVRDQTSADLDTGIAGTDGSAIVLTDTDLISPDTNTRVDLIVSQFDEGWTATQVIPPKASGTENLKEWALENLSGTVLTRSITAPVVWNPNVQITRITGVKVDRA